MSDIRWVPLEINPDVMNVWAEKAGLSAPDYEFRDIYTLDPEMLAIVPQPVKAVILLFPWTAEYRKRRDDEHAKIDASGQYPIDPRVIWIKQTIANACGTMALLHSLANAGLPIEAGSTLERFLVACQGKTGTERAAILENSAGIAKVHEETALMGQTVAPDSSIRVEPHYTCFVHAPSGTPGVFRMVELDGERTGPVDRGASENLLEDAAKFIKQEYIAKENSYEFGILALTPKVSESL